MGALSKSRKRKKVTERGPWPALPLLEYTMGLARLLAARPMNQAALARAAGVDPAYISSVMSGNENLTAETMAKIASAAGGEVHVCVAEKGTRVRWIEDNLEADTGLNQPVSQFFSHPSLPTVFAQPPQGSVELLSVH
jgi:transcriptional regulator with XRE-family HTH domain